MPSNSLVRCTHQLTVIRVKIRNETDKFKTNGHLVDANDERMFFVELILVARSSTNAINWVQKSKQTHT